MRSKSIKSILGHLVMPGFLILDPQGEIRAPQIGAVPASMIEQFIESHSTSDQATTN